MKLNNRHILIVDDDKINCEVLDRAIKIQGGSTSVCHNTSDAANILTQNDIDLILLDMHFPEGDAFPFIDAKQSNQTLKEIPILIISSDNDEEIIMQALNKGAIDYLVKPVKLWQLLPKIYKHFKDTKEKKFTFSGSNEIKIKCDIELNWISAKEMAIISPIKFLSAEESMKIENNFLEEMQISEAICKTLAESKETGSHSQYLTRIKQISLTEDQEEEIQKRIINWMT